jgi:hypothetical protein
MLCEYKGAYENRHQYVGWTIDQEPLLYEKVIKYFGKQSEDISKKLWSARESLHPKEVLGEIQGWGGTRWDLARVLRDYGYVWSDLKYDYWETLKSKDWSKPIKRNGDSSPMMSQENFTKKTSDKPSIMSFLKNRHNLAQITASEIPQKKKEFVIESEVAAPTLPSQTENLRKSINTIIPEKLYQRGQILSWKRQEKEQFLSQHKIGLVVNFWSKIDNDMSELPVMYWHIPTPHSDDMVSSKIVSLAKVASDLMQKESLALLSLCEAGKTRSVFFAILIASNLLGCSKKEAYEFLQKKNINMKLRPSMIHFLTKE